MSEIYLPVLSHFENGNPWSASAGRLRYLITPGDEGLTVQVWEGPWSYEFSAVEDKRCFPLSEEGIGQLTPYLSQWQQTMEARPRRTLTEEIARRNAQAAAREPVPAAE